MKAYVRRRLAQSYSKPFIKLDDKLCLHIMMAPGLAIGKPGKSVSWGTSLETMLEDHGVRLIGWPPGSQFRDPSKLQMWELEYLVDAVGRGTCYFERAGRYSNTVVKIRKLVPENQGWDRQDKGKCRGRQAHPAKPRHRGKTGKQFHPYSCTINGELPEDPIEEVE